MWFKLVIKRGTVRTLQCALITLVCYKKTVRNIWCSNFDQLSASPFISIAVNKIIIIYSTNNGVKLMSNLHILMELNDFHNFSYKKEVLDN